MEKGRAMVTRRARLRQPGIFSEQSLERCCITVYDCVHCCFERRDRRVRPLKPFKMFDKLRPARETMTTRDKELCVGQPAPRSTFILRHIGAPTIFHLLRIEVDPPANLRRDLVSSQPGNPFYPACGPVANCA